MRQLLITLTFCLFWAGNAAADIEISPLRQVLSQSDRQEHFRISNPSGRILDGRVRLIDLQATDRGYGEPGVAERKIVSAGPYLTITPAYFRLKPGANIDITVKLKDGVSLPRGERRSHLLIETAASRTPIRKASNQGLQVDIGLGVSAPILVRGVGAANAKIGETQLARGKDGKLRLISSVLATNSHSAYGRLVVSFLPARGKNTAQTLSMRSNVAAFPGAPARIYEIPLERKSLGRGELTIRYEGEAEFTGRIFDERSFDIEPPD